MSALRANSAVGCDPTTNGRLHSFRHYFASMCALSGVSESVAMQWLGHQDSGMVRHYFHLHDAESRRQMDRLEPIKDNGTRLAGTLQTAPVSNPEGGVQPSNPTMSTRENGL